MLLIIRLLSLLAIKQLITAASPSYVFDYHNFPVTEEVREVRIGRPFLQQFSSLFSTQKPQETFLEHHGLLVAYYKAKDGLSFFKSYGSEIFTDYEFMPWEKDNEKVVFLRNQWVSMIPVKN